MQDPTSYCELQKYPAIRGALDQRVPIFIYAGYRFDIYKALKRLPAAQFSWIVFNSATFGWFETYYNMLDSSNFKFPSRLTEHLSVPNLTPLVAQLGHIKPNIEYRSLTYAFAVFIDQADDDYSKVLALFTLNTPEGWQVREYWFGLALEPEPLDLLAYTACHAQHESKHGTHALHLYLDGGLTENSIEAQAKAKALGLFYIPLALAAQKDCLPLPLGAVPQPPSWPEAVMSVLKGSAPVVLFGFPDDENLIKEFSDCLSSFAPAEKRIFGFTIPVHRRWADWLVLAKDNIVPITPDMIEDMEPMNFTDVQKALDEWRVHHGRDIAYYDAHIAFFVFIEGDDPDYGSILKAVACASAGQRLTQSPKGITLESANGPSIKTVLDALLRFINCAHDAGVFYLFRTGYDEAMVQSVNELNGHTIQVIPPGRPGDATQQLLEEMAHYARAEAQPPMPA